MVDIKDKVKKIAIDKNRFQVVDTIDGTVIDQGIIPLYKDVDTNQVIYDFKKYVYANTLDLQTLIKNNIRMQDLGLLLLLSCNLKPIYNICMADDENAHTAKTIGKLLNSSESQTKRNLNKLVELGVIAHRKIKGQESLGKVYIVNPTYIKNGRNTSKIIPTFFYKPSTNKDSMSNASVLKEIKNNMEKADNYL